MEFVILGLLMVRDQTLYQLKKAFEDTIALFYSASFGSLSAAIGKLVAKQWIVMEQKVDNGRNKKIYAITPTGTAAFQDWSSSPIPNEKVKDPALTRLFFMGDLDPHQRITVIETHIATLEAMYAALELLEKQAETLVIPAAYQERAAFQKLTLRYGSDYYAFSIDWFKRLLITLQEQDHDRNF